MARLQSTTTDKLPWVSRCGSLSVMNTAMSAIESEFASVQEEQAYEKWLQEKVKTSLAQADDPATPRYSTDEVMQRMDRIVEAAKTRHAARRLA